MKRILIFPVTILLMIAGCSPAPKTVRFSVVNNASDDIHLYYSILSVPDTTFISVASGDAYELLETENANGATNWYYDYKVQIHTITNLVDDTIDFNPNISQYWSLYTGGIEDYYQLNLVDTVF